VTGSRTFDVTIVGGGASGTLLALQLLKKARQKLRLLLVDRSGDFGRGIAYRTTDPSHVVNVPAARMSALPNDEGHFLSWLRRRDEKAGPETYALRRLYGDYLVELLSEAQRGVPTGVVLERLEGEVGDVEDVAGGLRLRVASGEDVVTRLAVLALGNPPPSPLPTGSGPHVWQWPWPRETDWPSLDARVLLVGAGLTAVDLMLSLSLRGHRGPIHVLSRHGLLPQRHGQHTLEPLDLKLSEVKVRGLFRTVRAAAVAATDWRPVLDGVRAKAQTVWKSLEDVERRRFGRHVRTLWEVHRHRLAPDVAVRVDELLASGQLQLHAGRLLGVADKGASLEARYRSRGLAQQTSLEVDLVVNCTGPAGHAAQPDALVRNLLRQGRAVPGPLGLGLATDARGALLDAKGNSSVRLWTLGPVRRGEVWESTAIPDIRVQAAELATHLVG
jgi:uncharacterized NAD(P)/FAD-binding protein YdhS